MDATEWIAEAIVVSAVGVRSVHSSKFYNISNFQKKIWGECHCRTNSYYYIRQCVLSLHLDLRKIAIIYWPLYFVYSISAHGRTDIYFP